MKSIMRADVVVVGAGSAGSAAALLCARRGLSVLCLDRRPIEQAGARWVNGVPGWMFDWAGIGRPGVPELLSAGEPFHMFAGWGPERLVVREHDVLEVDMRQLVSRLQGEGEAAGVRFLGEVQVYRFDGKWLHTSLGAIGARFVVDASGLVGAGLLGRPGIEREHLCVAAQEVRAIREPGAARDYFASHKVPIGDTACFTGVEGGFSVLNLKVHAGTVSILTGSIPALGHRSGRRMLDDFVREQPWVGERIFGGSLAIPLRRPFERIADGKVALLGDAACQVFSAHGSGVGAGLVAARLLADALATGKGTHGYALSWQRRWGGLLAAYDLFRRFSQTVSVDELAAMFDHGFVDMATALEGLEQRMPGVDPALIAGKLRAGMRNVAIAARLAPVVARMMLVRLLYRQFPARPELVPKWSRQVRRLFGESEADPVPNSRRAFGV
ncbi:MAG: FAD-binding protein [Bradymonadaceae bacterium]|nr:FAD-binding protein [Lujinxingiaceae bacterium]